MAHKKLAILYPPDSSKELLVYANMEPMKFDKGNCLIVSFKAEMKDGESEVDCLRRVGNDFAHNPIVLRK